MRSLVGVAGEVVRQGVGDWIFPVVRPGAAAGVAAIGGVVRTARQMMSLELAQYVHQQHRRQARFEQAVHGDQPAFENRGRAGQIFEVGAGS